MSTVDTETVTLKYVMSTVVTETVTLKHVMSTVVTETVTLMCHYMFNSCHKNRLLIYTP